MLLDGIDDVRRVRHAEHWQPTQRDRPGATRGWGPPTKSWLRAGGRADEEALFDVAGRAEEIGELEDSAPG